MAYVLQDSYITGDGSSGTAQGATWLAQTFTTGEEYDISRVSLKLYRVGLPGTLTVSIRATAAAVPSGADLCSGTFDADTLTEVTSGDWYDIDFSSTTTLTTATLYAIVINAAAGDVSNNVHWRRDNDPSGYADGAQCSSSNSGSTWAGTTNDCLFETYSGALIDIFDVTGTLTGAGDVSGTVEAVDVLSVTATIAGSGTISGTVYTSDVMSVTATITGSGTISAVVAATTQPSKPLFITRLVAIGNDRFYYEDL